MRASDRCFDEELLPASEIKRNLPKGWALKGRLIRTGTLDFDTFPTAIRFVDRLAAIAERENHHPEILISWRRVRLELTTHDAGGVTRLDIRMARLINSLIKSYGRRVRHLNK